MIRRLVAFVKSPIARWTVGVTLLMCALLIWRPTFCEFFELKLYDLKFRFRGPIPAGKEVAILAIDDESLKIVGRWPWSRDDMARVLTRLKQAGPRAIALDIIFAEKEQTVAYQALKKLTDDLARQGVPPEILKLLEGAKNGPMWTVSWPRFSGRVPPSSWGSFSGAWVARSAGLTWKSSWGLLSSGPPPTT